MRIAVDAVGCGEDGVTTYWTSLVQQWARDWPDDDVVVVRADSDREWSTPGVGVRTIRVNGPDYLVRPLALTRALKQLHHTWAPDVVLAVRPATAILPVGAPLAVVVHDLRHELRPDQFSWPRRAARRVSYGLSLRAADGVISVSQRTRDDLESRYPSLSRRPGAVVHHGADHTDQWQGGHCPPSVVAFGHHANKNVDLVLRAWRRVVDDSSDPVPRLQVLGLDDQRRSEVVALTHALGLERHVSLSAFLDEDAFHAVMANAVAVLYPSDFEGFGLPVVEAMRLGKPVVTSPDAAIREVAGDHAFSMASWELGALVTATKDALAATTRQLELARDHASRFTWRRSVSQTRRFLQELSSG